VISEVDREKIIQRGDFQNDPNSARRSGRENVIRRAEDLKNLICRRLARQRPRRHPDSVAAWLEELRQRRGSAGILADLNCGGLIPRDRVMNALRLLCREVMPRFH
jgi:hypothetical protein